MLLPDQSPPHSLTTRQVGRGHNMLVSGTPKTLLLPWSPLGPGGPGGPGGPVKKVSARKETVGVWVTCCF